MQAELWSLNGLAVELGRDRRALARDLEGLKPDEEVRKGSRTERKWRLKRVIEHLNRPNSPEVEHDYENERERLAAAQAEKVEMENAVRRGQLADTERTLERWNEMIAAARAKLLGMGTKLGPQLTNVGDASVIAAAIRTEVYAALAELADYEPADGSSEPSGVDEAGGEDVETAAEPDGQPMGRRKSKAE